MHTVLMLEQLTWTGHVIQMPDEPLPESFLLRSTGGKALSRWTVSMWAEKKNATLTNLGIGRTGAIKVVQSH